MASHNFDDLLKKLQNQGSGGDPNMKNMLMALLVPVVGKVLLSAVDEYQRFGFDRLQGFFNPKPPKAPLENPWTFADKPQPKYESPEYVILTDPEVIKKAMASREVHIVKEFIGGSGVVKRVTDSYDKAKAEVDVLLIHKNLPIQVTDPVTKSCIWGDPQKYAVSLEIYPVDHP